MAASSLESLDQFDNRVSDCMASKESSAARTLRQRGLQKPLSAVPMATRIELGGNCKVHCGMLGMDSRQAAFSFMGIWLLMHLLNKDAIKDSLIRMLHGRWQQI
jgi:hypothetical protein